MSAFLGPIHFMMYNKIQKQNDLLDEVIAYMQDNNIIPDLSSKLKEKYGENEREELESVIDLNAIHSWLNNQVNIAESRLAYTVKLIIEKDKSLMDKMGELFYSNGMEKRLECAEIIVVEELFKMLNITLLDGMRTSSHDTLWTSQASAKLSDKDAGQPKHIIPISLI